MKLIYDATHDIADIVLSDDLDDLTSEVVRDDLVLDFAGDVLVRIEVQEASRHLPADLLATAQRVPALARD